MLSLSLLFLDATSSDPSSGGANGLKETLSEISNKLIPSWLSFVVQFSSFIILLLVVFFLAYKPVKKILKERGDYIENEIKQAEESNALASKNVTQSEEAILASKKKASEIIESANQSAKQEYENKMILAQEEIAQMKELAKQDIERSKKEALEEIHDEMVSVALAASSEILKREVNQEDDSRIAEEFIKNLN